MSVKGKWYPWLLDQNKIWINARGEIIDVSSIDGRYALNILKFMVRNGHATASGDENVFATPLGAAFYATICRDLKLYGDEVFTIVDTIVDDLEDVGSGTGLTDDDIEDLLDRMD